MKFSLQLEAIILFCWDIQLLKSFYVDLLGMDVIASSGDNWIVMESGACQLCLHKIGQGYDPDSDHTHQDPRNTKIVLSTDDDIRKIRDYLISHDTKMKEVLTWEGYDYWVCDGEDPEGNVFQLKQVKSVN